MIAGSVTKTQALIEPKLETKLKLLEESLQRLARGEALEVPIEPGRDVQILPLSQLPNKSGLATTTGQARLIHDLASIELQAMELGLRTLSEYPDAPNEFREQLIQVTKEEGHHLQLCLKALESLDSFWGAFPTHIMLWKSTHRDDTLLDRILIVHRYLEGSGLDASEKIMRRLSGVQTTAATREALNAIQKDEFNHVRFGSYWYQGIVCKETQLTPADDMKARLKKLETRLPRRLETIHYELRRQAGFLPEEIEVLREFQSQIASSADKNRHLPSGKVPSRS